MGVKQQHREDGERAQAVDVAPVALGMVCRRYGNWSVHRRPYILKSPANCFHASA